MHHDDFFCLSGKSACGHFSTASNELIGTIRREFLDHILIWHAVDLERKLEEFRCYYNEHRVHQALMAVLRENDLANRRLPMPPLPATRGGTIAASVPDADRGVSTNSPWTPCAPTNSD
jgi:hypothetical protein